MMNTKGLLFCSPVLDREDQLAPSEAAARHISHADDMWQCHKQHQEVNANCG